MKILEINKFYYLRRGAEKHFLDLLALLEENGQETAIFAMDHPKNLKTKWNRYFPSYVGYGKNANLWQKIKGLGRLFWSFEAQKIIAKLLNEFQPDIVHIHNIYHQISPSILFEIKKLKIPIVMTVHDFALIYPNHSPLQKDQAINEEKSLFYWNFIKNKGFKNSYLKSFLAVLEQKFINWTNCYDKNIDLYLAPSEFVRKILIKNGVNPEKIEVLPHFIKTEKSNLEEIKKEENENFQKNKPYFLCLFGISKEKGTDKLIKIFQQIPEANLFIAGGKEENTQSTDSENIKYLGFLKQNEIKRYIENCQAVISLSGLMETFGLTALEANALGKPFIGLNTGALGEIIKNGENGFLVKNEEGLEKIIEKFILTKNDKINSNQEEIRKNVNLKYHQKKYCQKLLTIFKKYVNFAR